MLLISFFSSISPHYYFIWDILCPKFDITIVLFLFRQLDISSDIASTVLTFKSRGVEQEELAFLRGELKDSRFIIETEDCRKDTTLSNVSEKSNEGDMEVSTEGFQSGLIDFDDIFCAVEEENENAELNRKSKKRSRIGETSSSSSVTAVLAAFGTDSTARAKKEKIQIVTKIGEATSAVISGKTLVTSADAPASLISQVTDCVDDNKNKKGKKNKRTDMESSVSSVSLPVGLSLKQQLQNFKNKIALGDQSAIIKSVVKVDIEGESFAEEEKLKEEEENQKVNKPMTVDDGKEGKDEILRIYVPIPTDEPVGTDGRVLQKIPNEEELTDLLRRRGEGKDPKGKSANIGLKNPVQLNRDSKIQAARLNLPVCGMEQEIVEAITLNDVVILCGETGSGKSTQVPQFLFEAGYGNHGMIGITQPRRVAATSTAERVGVEMGEPINASFYGKEKNAEVSKKQKKNKKQKDEIVLQSTEEEEKEEKDENEDKVKQGNMVGYQIRFDASTVGERTKIKFMTDGILLREVTSDLLLRQYSVILLDEAHERNVNTDILLGMISR